MGEFLFTQTSIKDLEKDSTCPARWKAQWLDKTIRWESNENMDRGKYFEWICLGGGAVTGEDVVDLPRTTTGKKTIHQIRIEQQAERFKRMFTADSPEFIGHTITTAQLELSVGDRKGTIDFVSTCDGYTWINDLKLTSDLSSTRTEYGWGHDWTRLDMLQMVHYQDLYSKIYGVVPKVGLWVFDYSSDMRIKIGEVVISDKAKDFKEVRFEAASEVMAVYQDKGWPRIPSEPECRGCNITSCTARWKPAPIERVVINI